MRLPRTAPLSPKGGCPRDSRKACSGKIAPGTNGRFILRTALIARSPEADESCAVNEHVLLALHDLPGKRIVSAPDGRPERVHRRRRQDCMRAGAPYHPRLGGRLERPRDVRRKGEGAEGAYGHEK